MKAFTFRLDPALRWRSAQLRLEQEKLSRIGTRLAVIQADTDSAHSELRAGSAALPGAGSAAFGAWAAYAERCRRRIQSLEEQSQLARRALALQNQIVIEAHRKLRVIGNLEQNAKAEWVRELDRETDAFAGEVFLARMSRESRRRA